MAHSNNSLYTDKNIHFVKKYSPQGEKLLKKARVKAYRRYYLWLASYPEIRQSLVVSHLRFKIKK